MTKGAAPSPRGLSAAQHLQALHRGADGWITLARKDLRGRWDQHHFRWRDALAALDEWLGTNTFFSQSTFLWPARRVEALRELRALYVDIDCYTVGLHPQQVLLELELDHYRHTIPEPNLEIWSGRGLALVWLLQPEKALALPRWQAAQHYICRQLARYGADAGATDPTRVLRLAGSVNGKSGAQVMVYQRHAYRHDLRGIIREHLPEVQRAEDGQRRRGRPPKLTRFFNLYSLHYERLQDAVRLCELRGWRMNGYRAKTCFLYRYWTCLYQRDAKAALEATLGLNQQFTEPLTVLEAARATKAAERAWREYEVAAEAGLLHVKTRGVRNGYNYTNERLIELLDITEEEQRHLRTIIGPVEKRRRDRERKQVIIDRRRGGRPSQAEARAERMAALQAAMAAHPGASQRELARILGWSLCKLQKTARWLEGISDLHSRAYIGGT